MLSELPREQKEPFHCSEETHSLVPLQLCDTRKCTYHGHKGPSADWKKKRGKASITSRISAERLFKHVGCRPTTIVEHQWCNFRLCHTRWKVFKVHTAQAFRPKLQSCSVKFEHLPSDNLTWHDPVQHHSSTIVGIEHLTLNWLSVLSETISAVFHVWSSHPPVIVVCTLLEVKLRPTTT